MMYNKRHKAEKKMKAPPPPKKIYYWKNTHGRVRLELQASVSSADKNTTVTVIRVKILLVKPKQTLASVHLGVFFLFPPLASATSSSSLQLHLELLVLSFCLTRFDPERRSLPGSRASKHQLQSKAIGCLKRTSGVQWSGPPRVLTWKQRGVFFERKWQEVKQTGTSKESPECHEIQLIVKEKRHGS